MKTVDFRCGTSNEKQNYFYGIVPLHPKGVEYDRAHDARLSRASFAIALQFRPDDLSNNEFAVYKYLHYYYVERTKDFTGWFGIFPSYETISKDTGLARSTIGTLLKQLKKKGYIGWENRLNTSNRYWLTEKIFQYDPAYREFFQGEEDDFFDNLLITDAERQTETVNLFDQQPTKTVNEPCNSYSPIFGRDMHIYNTNNKTPALRAEETGRKKPSKKNLSGIGERPKNVGNVGEGIGNGEGENFFKIFPEKEKEISAKEREKEDEWIDQILSSIPESGIPAEIIPNEVIPVEQLPAAAVVVQDVPVKEPEEILMEGFCVPEGDVILPVDGLDSCQNALQAIAIESIGVQGVEMVPEVKIIEHKKSNFPPLQKNNGEGKWFVTPASGEEAYKDFRLGKMIKGVPRSDIEKVHASFIRASIEKGHSIVFEKLQIFEYTQVADMINGLGLDVALELMPYVVEHWKDLCDHSSVSDQKQLSHFPDPSFNCVLATWRWKRWSAWMTGTVSERTKKRRKRKIVPSGEAKESNKKTLGCMKKI